MSCVFSLPTTVELSSIVCGAKANGCFSAASRHTNRMLCFWPFSTVCGKTTPQMTRFRDAHNLVTDEIDDHRIRGRQLAAVLIIPEDNSKNALTRHTLLRRQEWHPS